MSVKRTDILICFGSGCVSAGATKIKEKISEELKKHHLESEINLIETGCMGPCDFGPVMMVYPEGVFYKKLSVEAIPELVEEHFVKGRPLKKLMVSEKSKVFDNKEEIPFYKQQTKVTLKNCGFINPEKIEEYIAVDGYQALGKIITENKPEEIIEIMKQSGLRGRGGGGFPTGLKWEFVRNAKGSPKYVICNGDEGDPGAFMDRSLLEGDPHRVLEGMLIAAYSVGANRGFFYIRAEYPLAIRRIKNAIKQAREYGLIGEKIFGSDFSFEAEVRTGAGAFVCGEETALIASIQGERGQPMAKPPYPAISGVWRQPTLVNNVETLANLASIILKGPEWFSSMGIETSRGTKVFALTGDVKNTGLVEVPFGITLRELIYGVGGGMEAGKTFKAVQLGGPSGGCLTEDHLDLPIDYESLKKAGAMVGSGGMIIMNNNKCMVDVAKFFLEFSMEESCGKCTPCRVGLKEMHRILDKITKGEGVIEDLDKLETLGKSVKELSLCGLGQTAPNPVLSTLRYFRSEYEAHIKDKSCPAKVCGNLMYYSIDKNICVGCSLCAKNCPVTCIFGSRTDKYEITQQDCIKCGNCMSVCPVNAISKLPGMPLTQKNDKIDLYN